MLHIAVESGNLAILNELISNGADIKARTKTGKTVLHIASENGYIRMIEYILTVFDKKDIESVDKYNMTALISASIKGEAKAVKLLLKVGANNKAVDKNGWTALMLACLYDRIEVIELLIEFGADKEALDKCGKTVLLLASGGFQVKIVELLLKAGANKEAADKDGWTALMYATSFCRPEVVEILIEYGANIESVEMYGKTALLLASVMGYAKIVETLLRLGANKDALDKDGSTALMLASAGGYIDVMDILLKAGSNKDIADKYGRTVFMLAVKRENFEAIKLLYRSSANINFKDIYGITVIGALYFLAIKKEKYRPLFLSIINHELAIVRKLLQKRVNNVSIKVKTELGKIKSIEKRTEESIKALMMVMECDGLIRDQIFKDVIEMPKLYKYILKNSQLKIDEAIFEISLKYGREKIKRCTSKEIINLFIVREIEESKEQKFSEENLEHKEAETGAWCIVA